MSKFALLVGVSDYLDVTNFSQIPFCYRDVLELHKRVTDPQLMEYRPIHVRLLHNLTTEDTHKPIENNISAMFDYLADQAKDGDTFLFYFSGHGCVKGGEAYFVGMDTRWNYLGIEGKGIKISQIRNRLNYCKASQKIAIIDACHSGENLSKKEGSPLIKASWV